MEPPVSVGEGWSGTCIFFNKKIKILRGFALVCVLALGLCLTGGLQIAEAKTTTYYDASAGRLHVKGTKLVDKKGHEVQLRGVSTHGLSWYPQYVNDKCFAQLHDKWGANVVRLAMYTEEYNGYCSGDAKNRSDLKKRIKKGVRLAKKHKMYVIVDWHILSDGNPNSHKKEAKAFFREMSREFKGYNNVIYEICNEPNNGTSWKEIKSYAKSVISTIRKNDKKAVIVVGTPIWSQDVDQAAADPIKGDNIMYALHFYAATHKTDLRNKMTAAINKGLPVFVTNMESVMLPETEPSTKKRQTAGYRRWMNTVSATLRGICQTNRNLLLLLKAAVRKSAVSRKVS